MNDHPTNSSVKPLYSTYGGDPGMEEMVDIFVEEMPDRTAKFNTLLAERDWGNLRVAAHQLKGAAGGYGFPQIGLYAASLENGLCEDLPEDQIRQAVDDLIELCRRARSGAPEY